jgi:hypothetical protein
MVDGDGRISGNDAIKFFALSNLSRPQLKQVYTIFFSLFNFCSSFQLQLSYQMLIYLQIAIKLA